MSVNHIIKFVNQLNFDWLSRHDYVFGMIADSVCYGIQK